MSDEPTLADLGEFAVIDRLVAGRPHNPQTLLAPVDDGAVVAASDGRVVVSTDMLVESRHFRLDWSTPHDVGRKSITQNAADVEAMGATAIGFVVAFGAPADTPAMTVDELADGMWEEARRVGADIVGGDLVSSPQWVGGGRAGWGPTAAAAIWSAARSGWYRSPRWAIFRVVRR